VLLLLKNIKPLLAAAEKGIADLIRVLGQGDISEVI